LNPVLGYLAIGCLLGPFGLGSLTTTWPWLQAIAITDPDGVQRLGEAGVILLLFVIGLSLSPAQLLRLRYGVFVLGAAQVVVTAAVIAAIARAFGNSPAAALVLGGCLALSSTAMVMQILARRRQLATPLGRYAFAVLLAQDLAVVPLLIVVEILGRPQESLVSALLLALVNGVLTLLVIVVAGRYGLRPLMRHALRSGQREVVMATILVAIIATAWASAAAGLSMALGALLAGMLLAETEYRDAIEVDIEPFKGLFLGLFFMTVGMGIDPRGVAAGSFWVVASVFGLFAIKAAITAGLALAFGLPRHVGIEMGVLLGQGGEFAFVVVGLAATLGLIPPSVQQFMLIVVGLSILVTPAADALAGRWGRALRRQAHLPATDEVGDRESHVLIAGYGRVGQMLGNVLDAELIDFVAIDSNHDTVHRTLRTGCPVMFGDAGRIELLERARAERAQALVLALDDYEQTERIIAAAHARWPSLPIIARARDPEHARRLLEVGASDVVPVTLESSFNLAGRVLSAIGVAPEVIAARLAHMRAEHGTDP
jgi:CPA2 family monovalent cation:H+ antiporter-2